MIDPLQEYGYWRYLPTTAGEMPLQRYIKMLEIFVETGDIAGRGVAWAEDEPWREREDSMILFLTRLMSDAKMKEIVLSDKLCSKIFLTSVGRFVAGAVHYNQFQYQRQWTERKQMKDVMQWSKRRRSVTEEWQLLIINIDEKHQEDGFDKGFYMKYLANGGSTIDEKWEKMVADWTEAADENIRRATAKHINEVGERATRALADVLKSAHNFREQNEITPEQAVQAWNMMDGRWTETEFLKHMTTVKLQDRYPQIGEVVSMMGRTADSNGTDQLTSTMGRGQKIEHSSGSDIEGITIGNDLNAILPSEAALYMDEEMEDAFLYKFVRRRLQTFKYKSNISKPMRHLSSQSARHTGPMIVCVDTSASMHGVPQRIIKSLLSLIEELAERLSRNCFLIDFSVSIKAIDLMQRRKEKFFESIGLGKNEYEFSLGDMPFIGSGTNATSMMQLMFKLLDNGGTPYVNADVLWVSDFLIPYPDMSYIHQMADFRKTGTRFYGLRIVPEGMKQTEWLPLFDKIYDITYRILRRF